MLIVILASIPGLSKAEDKKDTTEAVTGTKMILNYLCGPLDSVTLTAILSGTRGDMTFALKNATVSFYASASSDQLLGTAKTDQEGIAKLTISVNGLPADAGGMIKYLAKFENKGIYPGTEAEISAKPAKLSLLFSIEDSVKVLSVTATQKDNKGAEQPIPGVTVNIYVPRLFSLLKIGEVALDDKGAGTLEFPKEIVGDTLGNLVILAKIEEHDLFQFVQGKNTINWGVPKQYYKAEVPSRELWTPIAPVWMIITLIIMLLGVWAHYGYAIYELIMIKKISKDPDAKYRQ